MLSHEVVEMIENVWEGDLKGEEDRLAAEFVEAVERYLGWWAEADRRSAS